MARQANRKTLDHRQRADLFAQLAALERAAVPPAQALRTLAAAAPPGLAARLEQASRAAGSGAPVARDLTRAGLIDGLDARVLDAAATAGCMQQSYALLATRHGRAAARLRRLRGKLLMPAGVLLLAALVRPLPALILGELSPGGYLAAALGWLVLLLAGLLALVRLWGLLRERPLGRTLQDAALRLPLLGEGLWRWQRARYLDALALLIGAGVPAFTALRDAAAVVPEGQGRAAAERLWCQVEAGATLHQVCVASPLLSPRSSRLLLAGETSGTLDAMLERIAAQERESWESWADGLATWIPRLAYLLVAIWMAAAILGDHPVTYQTTRTDAEAAMTGSLVIEIASRQTAVAVMMRSCGSAIQHA